MKIKTPKELAKERKKCEEESLREILFYIQERIQRAIVAGKNNVNVLLRDEDNTQRGKILAVLDESGYKASFNTDTPYDVPDLDVEWQL